MIGIETCASHESTRHALLSRTPLDLCMGASQNSPNHPIETPKLSHPPCTVRVFFDPKTSGRQGHGLAGLPGGAVQLQRMWSWRDGLQSHADDCGLSGNESCPGGVDRCRECGPEKALIAVPADCDFRPLQLSLPQKA